MNILYKGVLLGMSVIALNAITLKELINKTLENNQNLKANKYMQQAKKKSFESVKNIYNPNLVIGANYNKLNLDVRNVQVGETTTGFLKFDINLYDGGRAKAIKRQKLYEYNAQKFTNITDKRDTILNVVTLYFNLKTINEDINVYKEKSKALKAQYERIKTKYDLHMVTKDEVLKLKSEYESNLYTIENLKYQKLELLKNLELLSGVKISKLDTNKLPNIKAIYTEPSDVKALKETLKANEENIKIAQSSKKPQIKFEDSLNFYKYNDYNEKLLNDLPDKQNQLILSITYNLFDTSSKGKIESSKLLKLSTANKLAFLKAQKKMEYLLAQKKVQTQITKIKSLKSAVEMANSVYRIIKHKYENGIVDNITYLDALSKKVYNLALYKQALNDLEIAKANLYLKSGIEYQKIINKF